MTNPNEELIDASVEGDLARAKSALRAGADLTYLSKGRRSTPFYCAASNGNMKVAALLLERGASLHVRDKDGVTPLVRLVQHDSAVGPVKTLLDWGAPVDEPTESGWTPLMAACTWDERWIPLIRLLLERGANVNHVARDDWTPLLVAIQCNMSRDRLVKLLLEHPKVDVNLRTRQYGWTPLIHASAGTNLEAVRTLLERGANVGAALKIAPGKGEASKGIDFFREAGAIKAKPEHDGFTALHFAMLKKRRCQKLLLEAGANPDAKARDGRTPRSLGKLPPPPKVAKGGSEAALLEAIARDPSDDAIRLVWADWLLEQSNPWGEVVQLAVKVAPLPADAPERKALAALEKKHAPAFLAPIADFVRRARFDRGLISHAVCDANRFATAAAAIADRAPGATVELTALTKKGLGDLCKASLGRFNRVLLESNRIDDAMLEQLVESPCLADIQQLSLHGNKFTDRGVIAFARSPNTRALSELGLSTWPPETLTAAALEALLALPRLRTLSMCCWGPGWAQLLARKSSPLRSFEATISELDDGGAQTLAASTKLEELKLRTHSGSIYDRTLSLTTAGADALRASIKHVEIDVRSIRRAR